MISLPVLAIVTSTGALDVLMGRSGNVIVAGETARMAADGNEYSEDAVQPSPHASAKADAEIWRWTPGRVPLKVPSPLASSVTGNDTRCVSPSDVPRSTVLA